MRLALAAYAPPHFRSGLRYVPVLLRRSRALAHRPFWLELLMTDRVGVVVTTNYDVSAEQTLRPTRLSIEPGFRYGGLDVALRATSSWFGRDNVPDPTPRGLVPICKLHGSLNWELHADRIEIHSDYRMAFRRKMTPAIVPPLPEKETPSWLAGVWSEAQKELSAANRWVVVGYSLPEYDYALVDLFARSAANVQAIEVHDPSEYARRRWQLIAPHARIIPRNGLGTAIQWREPTWSQEFRWRLEQMPRPGTRGKYVSWLEPPPD